MMAKKAKATKQRDNAWWPLVAPTEKIKLPGSGTLQDVREKLGLTQPALAQECGVSRDVIANYENGRTGMDIESALKIWRVLEIKERALVISRGKESTTGSAAEFLLGFLWYAKALAHKRLAEIDGQVDNLQRTRESIKHQIVEYEAEEAHLRTGFLGELLGKSTPLHTLGTGAPGEEHERKVREGREKMASIYGPHWEEVFGSLFDASRKNRDLEKRISELHDLVGLETKVARDRDELREKIQAPAAKE